MPPNGQGWGRGAVVEHGGTPHDSLILHLVPQTKLQRLRAQKWQMALSAGLQEATHLALCRPPLQLSWASGVSPTLSAPRQLHPTAAQSPSTLATLSSPLSFGKTTSWSQKLNFCHSSTYTETNFGKTASGSHKLNFCCSSTYT